MGPSFRTMWLNICIMPLLKNPQNKQEIIRNLISTVFKSSYLFWVLLLVRWAAFSCSRVLTTSKGWNRTVEQAPDDAPDMNAPKNETCNKTNLIVMLSWPKTIHFIITCRFFRVLFISAYRLIFVIYLTADSSATLLLTFRHSSSSVSVFVIIRQKWPLLRLLVPNYFTATRKRELIKESDIQSMESVRCPEISSDLQNLPKLWCKLPKSPVSRNISSKQPIW